MQRFYRSRPVHPHARGEHGITEAIQQMDSGSSPRPWGTPFVIGDGSDAGRFIPTPVGNTASNHWPRPSGPVHPHARGEHNIIPGSIPGSPGSSPRPWGTQASNQFIISHARFIPTPVGNTFPINSFPVSTAVHPHARGEHPTLLVFSTTPSVHPHARGEH